MFFNALQAPEIVVEGVAYREIVGATWVRTAFFSCERGRQIVRVKLVIPSAVVDLEIQRLRAFIACLRAHSSGPGGATLM